MLPRFRVPGWSAAISGQPEPCRCTPASIQVRAAWKDTEILQDPTRSQLPHRSLSLQVVTAMPSAWHETGGHRTTHPIPSHPPEMPLPKRGQRPSGVTAPFVPPQHPRVGVFSLQDRQIWGNGRKSAKGCGDEAAIRISTLPSTSALSPPSPRAPKGSPAAGQDALLAPKPSPRPSHGRDRAPEDKTTHLGRGNVGFR